MQKELKYFFFQVLNLFSIGFLFFMVDYSLFWAALLFPFSNYAGRIQLWDSLRAYSTPLSFPIYSPPFISIIRRLEDIRLKHTV